MAEQFKSIYKDSETALENMILTLFAIVFFFVSWLVANVPIGEQVTWVSALFIVVLALPSYYFLYLWLGIRRTATVMMIFSILPIIVEAIGISTGLPYGEFYYTDQMGFKIFGLVPWSVAFAFAPLVLGSITIATQVTEKPVYAILVSALLLVVVDLVLDPAAVYLNIWVWVTTGPYYGIPISNYTGWFLTAVLASTLMHLVTMENIREMRRVPCKVSSSLFLSLAFWTGFTLWAGLWIPLIIGIVMLVLSYFFLYVNTNST